MIVFSKTSEECLACEHYDDCNNKRMVACAFMDMPSSMLATAAESAVAPMLNDVAVKHDYRDVWIDPNTTVTIDLEDVKKQIERDFYKSIGLGLQYGG